MKDILTKLAKLAVNTILIMGVFVGIIGFVSLMAMEKSYKEYVRTSEELLMALEEICEQHDIHWGDTICETDQWSDYCKAREALGLKYLEHYSKR